MKRFFDISLSLFALLVTAPFLLVIAILIRMDSPGFILFKQKRVGKGGKEFWIYKLRTMVDGAQKLGPVITAFADPRVTQIGRVLRELKLDEIPQFINVLLGDMSLVGPRPEVPEMVSRYPNAVKERILSVAPGMLGPNQITHIEESTLLEKKEDAETYYATHILPEKLKADLAYVENLDPWKDPKFLLGGVWAMMAQSLKFRYILESRRRILFLLMDICMAVISLWAGYALRFEGEIPYAERQVFLILLPLMMLLRAPCFISFGLYQTLWQYLGIQELMSVVKAVTVGSFLLPFISFALQLPVTPRSVWIIDGFFLMLLLGGSRVLFKLTADRLRVTKMDKRKDVLIVGADDAGEMLIREYIRRPNLGYRAAGFVDDHPEKIGMRIHGVKVIGTLSQIAQIVKLKKIDEVVIALAEAPPESIRRVMRVCGSLKIPCRIVPPASNLLSPGVLPLKLRPVDVSDLLGRELVQGDQAGVHQLVRGKKILVTGAGGSIGSELARLLFQNNPKELILVDYSENNLYDIQMDLKGKTSETQVSCYLRNAAEPADMRQIFEKHKPQIIYHAAAYKHVPLVEIHYAKGILNNVGGSRVVADLAVEHGAETFVLISTDKAINPSSVMGATKRIAELYTQSLGAAQQKTRFLAVRFGNVFNSKGSVVPLFKKQIEEGGPVTVTDPRMTRYFMDVSEAVFLILQATVLGTESEIFVLDMGKPVRIVELAENLIEMSGLSTRTIEIKFIGLRPGEKLEEELELSSESSVATPHKKIRIWRSAKKVPIRLSEAMDDLLEQVQAGVSREDVIRKIKSIVPEYHPAP